MTYDLAMLSDLRICSSLHDFPNHLLNVKFKLLIPKTKKIFQTMVEGLSELMLPQLILTILTHSSEQVRISEAYHLMNLEFMCDTLSYG